MSVLIAEAVLLVLLIGISILIIVDQRLMSSVITYCAFSFAAMLLYTIVGAAGLWSISMLFTPREAAHTAGAHADGAGA